MYYEEETLLYPLFQSRDLPKHKREMKKNLKSLNKASTPHANK